MLFKTRHRKVLVTGSTGNLGLAVTACFAGSNRFEVIPTDHRKLDITNRGQTAACIDALRPEIVINCAAYTQVDHAETEKELCYRVNVNGPLNLADACRVSGATLVQISSDYVFDGRGTALLSEDDPTNPLNYYGFCKRLSEDIVFRQNPKSFVLRTSWLYGCGKNFVKTILQKARERQRLRVVSDQIGTPTSAKELSGAIHSLIDTQQYGLYHASGEGECSWHQFAQQILHLSGIEMPVKQILSKDFPQIAVRPGYAVMENRRLHALGMNRFQHWTDALEEYLRVNFE